jgi:hypothetical protein
MTVHSISPNWLQNNAGALPGICNSFSCETHAGMDRFKLVGKSVLKSEILLYCVPTTLLRNDLPISK